MIRSQSESSWRRASARADRVLTAVVVIVAGFAGAVLGSAFATAPVRIVQTVSTVKEYIDVPPPAAQPSEDAAVVLLAQLRCLTEAMYYEARGEAEDGEKAVAEVVLHRLQAGGYGSSICAVVYAGALKARCQFSFVCDGSRLRRRSERDWHKAQGLASRILSGELALADATGGALNYHAAYVRPFWAAKLVRTAQIGNHIFYRPRAAPMRNRRFSAVGA